MDANDDFVIVWEGDFQSSAWGVYGNYFTATNETLTTPATTWSSTGAIVLNNTPNNRGSFVGVSNSIIGLHDTGPRVAMDPLNGAAAAGFVVTWANLSGTPSNYAIFAQLFRAGGSAVSRCVRGQRDERDPAQWDDGRPRLAVDARRGRSDQWRDFDRVDELRPG